MRFEEFGFGASIMEGISAMGYVEPTPVQQSVIPEILAGHDLIACAQTGTGKTAAFLLPVMQQVIDNAEEGFISVMVVVPTRELAIQVAQQAEGIGYFTKVTCIAVYGGSGGSEFVNEQRALRSGVDLVVCTPGRMISHLNMGYVNLDRMRFLVLDEADRMLDMGFYDDIMKIISFMPPNRQSLLFSATMPAKIRELANRILRHPKHVNIALAKPPDSIEQRVFFVYSNQKSEMVKWLTRDPDLRSVIVFSDTKSAVKLLSRELRKTQKHVAEIHSDLDQATREEVMNRFKSRQIRVLVATDIISRGIDVEDIDLIINYNVPNDAEDYIHRIGRTARAQAKGKAYTLVGEYEQRQYASIEKLLGHEVPRGEVPVSFGETPPYKPETARFVKGRGRVAGHKERRHKRQSRKR